jgi:hypothetical protein
LTCSGRHLNSVEARSSWDAGSATKQTNHFQKRRITKLGYLPAADLTCCSSFEIHFFPPFCCLYIKKEKILKMKDDALILYCTNRQSCLLFFFFVNEMKQIFLKIHKNPKLSFDLSLVLRLWFDEFVLISRHDTSSW